MSELEVVAREVVTYLNGGKLNRIESGSILHRKLSDALSQPVEPGCRCAMRQRLVGDGCSVCNPEYAADHEVDPAPAQDERLLPDEVFADEFAAWWESDGQYVRAGGGDYERSFAFQAWRHLYPRTARPAQTEQQPVAKVIWPDEAGRRGGFSQLGHYDDPRLPVGTQLYAAPIAQPEQSEWISVEDRLPESGRHVLAYYTNSLAKGRRIRAEYVAPKSREVGWECADPDTQCVEHDEESDSFYLTEGWYELMDNWDEYSSIAVVEGVITHWMPLPATPSPAMARVAEDAQLPGVR